MLFLCQRDMNDQFKLNNSPLLLEIGFMDTSFNNQLVISASYCKTDRANDRQMTARPPRKRGSRAACSRDEPSP